METVEIKFRKKWLLLFIAVAGTMVIGGLVYVFVSNEYSQNNFAKILQAGLSIYFVYKMTRLLRMLQRNEAILLLTSTSITLNDQRSTKTIDWKDIRNVSILTNDSTQKLVLQMANGEETISISWLDKSPDQIQNLIEEYRRLAV